MWRLFVTPRIIEKCSNCTFFSGNSCYTKNWNFCKYFLIFLFSVLQLSEVDMGGATVFPDLGLTLWPRKGSAAFWYNLYQNGEGDVRTRHAACPVLAGTKWGEFVICTVHTVWKKKKWNCRHLNQTNNLQLFSAKKNFSAKNCVFDTFTKKMKLICVIWNSRHLTLRKFRKFMYFHDFGAKIPSN